MAEAIAGVLLEVAVSELSNAILLAIKQTWYFKSKLNEMKDRVENMRPKAAQIDKLNKELDRQIAETKSFSDMLEEADALVQKCKKIKLNFWKRKRYTSKLDKMSMSLRDYVQVELQLENTRDIKEILVVVTRLEQRELEKGSSSCWTSGVPLQKGDVIGFDDRVTELKAMMTKDSPNDDCSVVVVSAAGGSGKTTFVKLFCNDPEIQERFGPSGRNIRFVTVSQDYDPKVVITKLLGGELPSNTNNEDAIQQWGSFLGGNDSEKLLVLDDVWTESVITDFKFKLSRYKILVTSRTAFKQYKNYPLKLLNDQDATSLFRFSAFSGENEASNIPDDLVDKLVKCCKNHPLALSVIGGSLKGAHVADWNFSIKQLFEEKISVLNL